MGGARRRDDLQTAKPADAMIDMNHEVTGGQRLRFGQKILGPAFAFGRANEPVAEHVLFGNHGQPAVVERCLEPMLQGPDGKVKAGPAHAGDVGHRDRFGQTFVFDQTRKSFPRALGIGGDDHRPAVQCCANMVGQRPEKAYVFLLTFGREIASDASPRIDDTRAGRLRQRRHRQDPAPGNSRVPSGVIEVHRLWRGRLVDGVDPALLLHRMAAGVAGILDEHPTGVARRIRLIVKADRSPGQIVKQRVEVFMEEAQPMLHSGYFLARADVLVERVVGSRSAKLDAVILTEAGDRGVIENDLGHRRQFHHVELFGGPLSCRIEPAGTVQNVSEEVEPYRSPLTGRIDVDDAAAHRVVTGLRHRGCLRKSHANKELPQAFFIDPVTDPRAKGGIFDDRPGRNLLRRGVQRRQQNKARWPVVDQHRQCGHARGLDLGVGRHAVVGQAIPAREIDDGHVRCKEPQGGAHGRQTLVVAGDMDDRTVRTRQFPQHKLRVKAFRRATDEDSRCIDHGR